LIVEDHPDTAHMLRFLFNRRGLSAEVADSGEAALTFLEGGGRPQCLLVDNMMPGMTGLDLLTRLKALPEYAQLPVFINSAGYEWRDQMRAETIGAAAWFVKGVTSLDQIIARVMAACAAYEG